jgi:hypothetical protein
MLSIFPALEASSILWVSNSVIATCTNAPVHPNTPAATGYKEYKTILRILAKKLIRNDISIPAICFELWGE